MSYVPSETTPLIIQHDIDEGSEPDFSNSMIALRDSNFYFNLVFIIFFPLGILSATLNWGSGVIFIFNMLSIIALAKNLDFCTEQLSSRLGQTLAALLNASFGNAVELIIGTMAVTQNLKDVVQASLLGSVLSNLLFVLGFCFFLGGLKFTNQKFNPASANINSSMLGLSLVMFILPNTLKYSLEGSITDHLKIDAKVLMFSRGLALALLCVYVAFLIFQLHTHTKIFESSEDSEEESEVLLSAPVAIGSLVVTTILIAISAEYLVSSIEGLAEDYNLSSSFIGLIVLPIVGNAAEHTTAVFAAMRNQMDLAIGVSLGSSLQISVFVAPILVIFAWVWGVELTLAFPIFDIAVVFVSILLVTNLINDGSSNWLEGFMLLMTYFIIGFAYFLT